MHLQYAEGKSAWKLEGPWKKTLARELKRLSDSGKLIKVKNSFKLSDELKKAPVRCCPFAHCVYVRLLPANHHTRIPGMFNRFHPLSKSHTITGLKVSAEEIHTDI